MKTYKILLFIWMIFILHFSTTSGLLVLNPNTWFNHSIYSDKIHIRDILDLNSQFYWSYLQDGRGIGDLSIEFYSRKMAHAFFYAILALLFIKNFPNKFLLAPIFCFTVAFFDEINQFLMVGRSGRLADVLLDTFAALVITFIFFLKFIFKKNKRPL